MEFDLGDALVPSIWCSPSRLTGQVPVSRGGAVVPTSPARHAVGRRAGRGDRPQDEASRSTFFTTATASRGVSSSNSTVFSVVV